MPKNHEQASDSRSPDFQSEKLLLDAALRLARVGHWEIDVATQNLHWSDHVYLIHDIEVGTRMTVEQAIGFYHHEHRSMIESAVNAALAGGEPWDLECILITAKGREVWVRAIGEVIFENDSPVKVRGLVQDINDRKLQQVALADQEFRFRSMLDHTFNFISLLDPEGRIMEANETALKFGGFTLEQARGQNFADTPWWSTSDEINQQLQAALKEAKQGKFVRYDVEMAGAKDNIHVDFSISPIIGEDGEVKFLVPDARDITERRKTERRLQESLDQHRRFVSFAPAAVAMFDNDMRYIAASSKWIEDYNLSGIELIGKSHYEVFPEILDMPEWLEDHQRVLGGEEYQSEKDRFVREDGTVQWLKYTLLPWYEEPGKIGGLTMYTADITNEVEYQEKLAALNQTLEKKVEARTKELVQLNNEKEQFVYIASHDLQEPLRAISNYSSLINPEDLPDRGKKALDRIKKSATRMSSLVHGLLDYSLVGKSPERELVNLNLVIDEIKDDLQDTLQQKQAKIESNDLPVLTAAQTDMRQLFENLISNGLKYQQKNSPPLIRIHCEEQPDAWAFAVSDNGIGIKQEYQSKIFKIFSRLHGQDEYPGTGIGLAICKRIIDGYGGNIWLESAPGQGSTFHFTLTKQPHEA